MTDRNMLPADARNPLFLKGAPIFSSVMEEEDYAWSAMCHMRSLCPGESLVDYEDTSRDAFLVQSGEIRAVLRFCVGKEAILGTFRHGTLLGELAAIDNLPRSASLVAVRESQVVVIPQPVFLDILRRKPDVSISLLRLLSVRVRQMNDRVSELSFLDTKHRLYNTLLRLSRHRLDGGIERVISPPVVHAELAEHIGSSRETVSREMSRLMREALVERTSRAIILKNPGELSSRISRALET